MNFARAFTFFLFYSCLTLTSAAQSSNPQDNLIYYTTIVTQIKDATPKMMSLWGQLQQSLMTAGGNKHQQLDRVTIQSLKNASSENINDLNKKIRTVNALHETDTDLNVKQSVLTLFTEAMSIQESAMPVILSLMETGLAKINPQQTTTLKSFLSKGQELRQKSRVIENLLSDYRVKHNISPQDLAKFGL